MSYTDDQKEVLGRVVLIALYHGFSKVAMFSSVIAEIEKETRKLAWFPEQTNGSALLKHLEECGVTAAYHFPSDRQVRLYFSLIFPQGFFAWTSKPGRTLEEFLDKVKVVKPHKPKEQVMEKKFSQHYRGTALLSRA